jgi:hypothetical protein
MTAQPPLNPEALRDLYEACKNAVDAYCFFVCPRTWKTGTPQPHTEGCIKIRAAVAKAEQL